MEIAWSQNNAIWKVHDFAKNWPKIAEKWTKMYFLEQGVNKKVVGNDKGYLNMQYESHPHTNFWENPKNVVFQIIACKNN